jgi:hypothetical protein
MHVGLQPTTDKWQAIMHGDEERELPGNALASNPGQPFYALSKQFGNAFLSKFCGCEVPSSFARGCTLIDTPGILARKKQVRDGGGAALVLSRLSRAPRQQARLRSLFLQVPLLAAVPSPLVALASLPLPRFHL